MPLKKVHEEKVHEEKGHQERTTVQQVAELLLCDKQHKHRIRFVDINTY